MPYMNKPACVRWIRGDDVNMRNVCTTGLHRTESCLQNLYKPNKKGSYPIIVRLRRWKNCFQITSGGGVSAMRAMLFIQIFFMKKSICLKSGVDRIILKTAVANSRFLKKPLRCIVTWPSMIYPKRLRFRFYCRPILSIASLKFLAIGRLLRVISPCYE